GQGLDSLEDLLGRAPRVCSTNLAALALRRETLGPSARERHGLAAADDEHRGLSGVVGVFLASGDAADRAHKVVALQDSGPCLVRDGFGWGSCPALLRLPNRRPGLLEPGLLRCEPSILSVGEEKPAI